jgi:hypothetical protein
VNDTNPAPAHPPSRESPRYLTAEQTRCVYDRIPSHPEPASRLRTLRDQSAARTRQLRARRRRLRDRPRHRRPRRTPPEGPPPKRPCHTGIDISPHMHELATRRLHATPNGSSSDSGTTPPAPLRRRELRPIRRRPRPRPAQPRRHHPHPRGSPPRPRPRRAALPRQPHHRHNPLLSTDHPRLGNALVAQARARRQLPLDDHHGPPRPNHLGNAIPPNDHHARHQLRGRYR